MNPRVSRVVARWRRRPPGSRSPRSPPSSPSATRSTRSPTTSPRKTPASFEPTIDYVVTKVPALGLREVPGPAGGARHPDAVGGRGHGHRPHLPRVAAEGHALARARPPRPQRRSRRGRARRARATTSCCAGPPSARPTGPFQLEAALRRGITVDAACYAATRVDPWFLDQILMITEERAAPRGQVGFGGMTRAGLAPGQAPRLLRRPARLPVGACDRGRRCAPPALAAGVRVTFKTVDTCAAEFEAETPYHYSTYEDTDEVGPSDRPKVVILGSGPNRIGQGIEFDYCCVHASFALRDAGFETIMVNCNPETVSTDYDTSDRLYFEPLTYEDVMNVIEAEQPVGVIVAPRRADAAQAGRRAARASSSPAPAPSRSTWPRTATAGTRLCAQLEIPQPAGGTAVTVDEALAIVGRVGYPVLMRPSLRARRPGHGDRLRRRGPAHGPWTRWPGSAASARRAGCRPSARCSSTASSRTPPRSTCDAIRDHTGDFVIGGIMEHVEEAGVHSGDSACVLPPHSLSAETDRGHRGATRAASPTRSTSAGLHQRPVRGQGQPGVRDRGQPPRVAHGAVRGQGHRRAAGQGGRPGDARRHARRAAGRGPARATASSATTSP